MFYVCNKAHLFVSVYTLLLAQARPARDRTGVPVSVNMQMWFTPRSDSSAGEDPPTPATPRSDAAGDSGTGSGMNSPNAVTPDREDLDMSDLDECYNSDSSDGDD